MSWFGKTYSNTVIPGIVTSTNTPLNNQTTIGPIRKFDSFEQMYGQMFGGERYYVEILQARIQDMATRLARMEELWQTHYCAVPQTQEGDIVIETSDCEKCKSKVLP